MFCAVSHTGWAFLNVFSIRFKPYLYSEVSSVLEKYVWLIKAFVLMAIFHSLLYYYD